MRLWHKELIDVLPRQQLLGQWRECCCIALNLSKSGTPNHILVNKILDYPIDEFFEYTENVINEMKSRGYKVQPDKFWKYFPYKTFTYTNNLYKDWHNERYLKQCLFNLEEKYDCGGITSEEWSKILRKHERKLY